jgi:hypothetical protein
VGHDAAVRYQFDADVWVHDGEAAWHFLTLPTDVTDEIDDLTAGRQKGFGSVPVAATIGATTWSTSIFPDTKRGSFVLPVKKPVRLAEGISDGDTVGVALEIRLD